MADGQQFYLLREGAVARIEQDQHCQRQGLLGTDGHRHLVGRVGGDAVGLGQGFHRRAITERNPKQSLAALDDVLSRGWT